MTVTLTVIESDSYNDIYNDGDGDGNGDGKGDSDGDGEGEGDGDGEGEGDGDGDGDGDNVNCVRIEKQITTTIATTPLERWAYTCS